MYAWSELPSVSSKLNGSILQHLTRLALLSHSVKPVSIWQWFAVKIFCTVFAFFVLWMCHKGVRHEKNAHWPRGEGVMVKKERGWRKLTEDERRWEKQGMRGRQSGEGKVTSIDMQKTFNIYYLRFSLMPLVFTVCATFWRGFPHGPPTLPSWDVFYI